LDTVNRISKIIEFPDNKGYVGRCRKIFTIFSSSAAVCEMMMFAILR